MGMPRGLAKATNFYNKQEAWKDWLRLAKQAHLMNCSDLVRKFQPADNAGWRKIDKATAALREEMKSRGVMQILVPTPVPTKDMS
jgi:hypothetical protein